MTRLVRLAVALTMLCAAPCHAEDKDPAGADALFRAGREAAERNDPETACRRFTESYRLDPAVGTLLNVADCEVALGRLADASEHYRRVLDTLEETDDRVPLVKTRLAAVEPRVPRLELTLPAGAPAGVEILRDGVRLTPASVGVALPQNPGPHELVVSAPGHSPRHYSLVLGEADLRKVTVEPGAPDVNRPSPAPVIRSAPPSTRSRPMRTIAHGLMGAGAVSAVAAGVLAWRYAEERSTVQDHCPSVHGCDDTGLRAASLADFLQGATVAFGVAALATFGGGVALLWLEPADTSPGKGVRTGGITWQTTF